MLPLFVLVAVVVASTSHRAVNSGTTIVRGVAWRPHTLLPLPGEGDQPLCFSHKLTAFSSGLQTLAGQISQGTIQCL